MSDQPDRVEVLDHWNLTRSAKRAVAFASGLAIGYTWNAIGSDHLLLGVLAEDDRSPLGATSVLESVGAPIERIRKKTLAMLESGPDAGPVSGLTPRTWAILDQARQFADTQSQQLIGTGHILAGLLLEGTSRSAELLAEHGVSADAISAALTVAGHVARARSISPGAGREITGTFEGVETYIERVLADSARPIDPHLEAQLHRYQRILSDLHQVDELDVVAYERIMASMLRLLAEVLETDTAPDDAPPEAIGYHNAAVVALREASQLGDEDEAIDAQKVNAAMAAIETTAVAGHDLVAAVSGSEASGFAPGAGAAVDAVLDGFQPWADRVSRGGKQVRALMKEAGIIGVGGTAIVGGVSGGYSTALRLYLSGAAATLNWVITVIQHAWPG